MAVRTKLSADKALLYSLVIEDCAIVTDKVVKRYGSWLHAEVFPPARPTKVKAFAVDGHEKVLQKLCAADTGKRSGRPRDDGSIKPFTNGWFMLTDPDPGRILSVCQMLEPENNAIALYPHVDLLFQRDCPFADGWIDRCESLSCLHT